MAHACDRPHRVVIGLLRSFQSQLVCNWSVGSWRAWTENWNNAAAGFYDFRIWKYLNTLNFSFIELVYYFFGAQWPTKNFFFQLKPQTQYAFRCRFVANAWNERTCLNDGSSVVLKRYMASWGKMYETVTDGHAYLHNTPYDRNRCWWSATQLHWRRLYDLQWILEFLLFKRCVAICFSFLKRFWRF